MDLIGQVVDANTGQPLAKATISVDGTPVGTTDSYGQFNITTPNNNVSQMEVSYIGYTTAVLPADQSFNETGQIQLTPAAPETLSPVTITAKAPSVAAKYAPYVLGGIGLLALAGKQKRSVRGIGKVNTNTILLGAVAVAGIYLLTRPKTVTPVYVPPVYNPSAALQTAAQNPTAQDISAAAPLVSSLANLATNIWG